MERKISINHAPSLSIDYLECVAKENFPECKVSVQKWGINSPFVIISKGFFVRAMVFIKQHEKEGQTLVGINGGTNPWAAALFGFIFYYVMRGDFINQVEDAMRKGLEEKFNVGGKEDNQDDTTIYQQHDSLASENQYTNNFSNKARETTSDGLKRRHKQSFFLKILAAIILLAVTVFIISYYAPLGCTMNSSAGNEASIEKLANDMIHVEGGSFIMGEGSDFEWTQEHKVTLSDFLIGRTEVTQSLWEAVMGTNPSVFKGKDLPVENVRWEDVLTFIQKLNALTGRTYRLPTEAEWEFAAMGGNNSNGFKFAGSNNLDEVAWYQDNSNATTHSVGTKFPNELGIYDMTGNVNEWCSDWYASYPKEEQTNPTGGPEDKLGRHIIRGGGWNSQDGEDDFGPRVKDRTDGGDSSKRHGALGFRLACDMQ